MLVGARRVEALCIKHRVNKTEELATHAGVERRVPERVGHHQRAEREKAAGDFEKLGVARALEIALPEPPPELLESAFQLSRALQRKEKVVEGKAGNVVGRVAPLAARAVEHAEVGALAKHNVPGMKIAVHLAQAPAAPLHLPAPVDAFSLDLLQHGAVFLRTVTVGDAEDAFAVADNLADAARIRSEERRV